MGLLDSFLTQGTTPPNPDATFPQLLSSPMGQGLLSAAFGYAANARRGTPLNNLGAGGLSGLLAYGNAQTQQMRQAEEAQQRTLRDLQIRQGQASLKDQEDERQLAQRFFSPSSPSAGGVLDSSLPPEFRTGAVPVPEKPAKFDLQGFAQARMLQNPSAGLKLLSELQKETPYGKIDPKDYTAQSIAKFGVTRNFADLVPRTKVEVTPAGFAYDPYATQPGSVMPDPNKPFSLRTDGTAAPNTAYQNYEMTKARAGATNVNVSTEKSLLSNFGEGLAKSMVGARDGAQSALGTIATVGRLNDALDSGKVMAGPGTTFRQFGLQVGNMLGVSGKDAQEKMLNTRQAIQSLAQLELDAAQQMKGQGQITEAERSIIRRAASGDIDGMTPPELRLLGGVLDRSARSKIRNYNGQVAPLMKNPNAAPLAPFLTVEEPPESKPASVVRRYNPATGKIE